MPETASSRYLWIIRHAKAERAPLEAAQDRDRPLTARGRRDAEALGKRLAAKPPSLGVDDGAPRPELIVCSAAVRTQETASLVAAPRDGGLRVDAYRSLYGAGADVVLRFVRGVDQAVTSLAVVGHNPTMMELVWELLFDAGERARLETHGFPTCALAVLAVGAASWEDVGAGSARLAGLFRPPY
ncbi:MAG: SixA phosphatase family protein [Acidimicrobiales bacterium]